MHVLSKEILDALARRYGREYLKNDPEYFPHCYAEPRDKEVVAFLAALLAYGNIKQIFRSVKAIIDILGEEPCQAIITTKPRQWHQALCGFRHRVTKGASMAQALELVGEILREHGSLEALFLEGYRPRDMMESLARFAEVFYKRSSHPDLLKHLLPLPRNGSACKRLNLFLRWVVRGDDGIDLGLWKRVRAADLVMPLDTHVARFGRLFGLTKRKTGDWRMAEEITGGLRAFCPHDPVRYDFAIAWAGVEGAWRTATSARALLDGAGSRGGGGGR
ncbi:MAG: TIGR02757 family protein [Acidobacteriota bacterium]|nr:MAG: TIGR02757 family protein [Acidobacteriota bacterium]